ncbi:hypothetical protein ACE1SV_69580 [Streptomyces sp. E-15]
MSSAGPAMRCGTGAFWRGRRYYGVIAEGLAVAPTRGATLPSVTVPPMASVTVPPMASVTVSAMPPRYPLPYRPRVNPRPRRVRGY